MSKCKRCDKLHMLRADYCEVCQPYQRIAELEKYQSYLEQQALDCSVEVQRLRAAIQAAFDCNMVPSTSVKDGGAARFGRQVEVADMLRAALQGEGEI